MNQFSCPKCGVTLKTSAALTPGKMIRCPKCSAVVPVPSPQGTTVATPPATVKPVPSKVQRSAPAPRPATVAVRPTVQAPPPRKSSGLLWVGVVLGLLFVCSGGVGAALLVVAFMLPSTTVVTPDGKATRATEAPKPLHLAYLTPDTSAVVILRPKRLLDAPLAKLLPAMYLESTREESGIDLSKVETVVAMVEPVAGAQDPALFASVFRFSAPEDGRKILDRGLRGVEEVTFRDRTYLRSKEQREMILGVKFCGFVADERTVVLGAEPVVQKILSGGSGNARLVERLGRMDLEHDGVGVVMLSAYRPVLAGAVEGAAPTLPPDLADSARRLPEKLEGLTFTLDLKKDRMLDAIIEAKDVEAATALEGLAKAGLDFLKPIYPLLRVQMQAVLPPNFPPELKPWLDNLPEGIKLSRDGVRVSVALEKPPAGAMPPIPLPPPPPPPQAERFSTQALIDETVAWVEKNHALGGPMHKIVTDVRDQVGEALDRGKWFWLKLGGRLVKSGKPTILAGWGGKLFVFEVPDEQAKLLNLNPTVMICDAIGRSDEGGRRSTATLSNLTIDNAADLDGGKDLTGSLTVRKKENGEGSYALRLSFSVGKTTYTQYKHLGRFPPNDGPMNFTFPTSRSGADLRGTRVVVVELVNFPFGEGQGPAMVVSNPVAALVTVTRSAVGAAPPMPMPPKPSGGTLADLKLTLPEGWKTNYVRFVQSWDVEKYTPRPNGLNESNHMGIREESENLGVDAYAEKLKQKNFLDIDYVWTEVTEKGSLPDGWFVTGKTVDHTKKDAKPLYAFVMVRTINGLKVQAKSSSLRSEATRKEAMEIFKTARIGDGK